ncbi:hypothetical protein GCM10010492_57870 [Saccharothrix mutabilis subsp. mutabilis]|uniref:Uncharacterized protein n=1 Tax=Saccharothrix mutabilis subsp. mutabilis TaxID=66855 RepID=A0ABN0UGV3_9PSEU
MEIGLVETLAQLREELAEATVAPSPGGLPPPDRRAAGPRLVVSDGPVASTSSAPAAVTATGEPSKVAEGDE